MLGWVVLAVLLLLSPVRAIIGGCAPDANLFVCEVTYMCQGLCLGVNANAQGCAACGSTLSCGTTACSVLLTCQICSLFPSSETAAVCQSVTNVCPAPCGETDFTCQLTQACTFIVTTSPTSPAVAPCTDCAANTCPVSHQCNICAVMIAPKPAFCSLLDCSPVGSGYQPTLLSLQAHPLPEWYSNAKLGVFIHWGLYTIPAFADDQGLTFGQLMLLQGISYTMAHNPYSEWYWSAVNTPGSPAAAFHQANFGGAPYPDFQQSFLDEAASTNVSEWVDLFKEMKARYVVPVTKHHDGFSMWNTGVAHPDPAYSNYHVPPNMDFIAQLEQKVRAAGMRFGLYYSGGEDWSQPSSVFPTGQETFFFAEPSDSSYITYADAQWRELISRFSPDILWNDYSIAGDFNKLQLFADYYNSVPEGVINDRWNSLRMLLQNHPQGKHYDYVTEELSLTTHETKWEFIRGVDHGFAWNRASLPSSFMTGDDIVDLLVEVVSNNGNLLLNVGPYANGTIPDNQLKPLKDFTKWIAQNDEAIFDTSPFTVSSTTVFQSPATELWFTATPSAAYAIITKNLPACAFETNCPCPVTLENLRLAPGSTVSLLGYNGAIRFTGGTNCTGVTLYLNLPASLANTAAAYAWSFKISPPPVYDNASAQCAMQTTLVYTGTTTGVCADNVWVAARLLHFNSSSGIAGHRLKFKVESTGQPSVTCEGVTNTVGVAGCSVPLRTTVGVNVRVVYEGTTVFTGSCLSMPLVVNRKPTSLRYMGAAVFANSQPATVSARLTSVSGERLPGRAVVFTAANARQNCSGTTTTADAKASCQLSGALNQRVGYYNWQATWAGDTCFASTTVSYLVLSFSFPTGGFFVVGDRSARGVVEFYGDRWSRENALSRGDSSANGFRGFVSGPFGVSVSQFFAMCGRWYPPYPSRCNRVPDDLPEYMGVVVADSVTKVRDWDRRGRDGNNDDIYNGNAVAILVVKPTEFRHGRGTGVVVATFNEC